MLVGPQAPSWAPLPPGTGADRSSVDIHTPVWPLSSSGPRTTPGPPGCSTSGPSGNLAAEDSVLVRNIYPSLSEKCPAAGIKEKKKSLNLDLQEQMSGHFFLNNAATKITIL